MVDVVDPRRVERVVRELAEWVEKTMPEEDRKRFEEARKRAEATGELRREVSSEEAYEVLRELADAFCKIEKESAKRTEA